MRSHSLFIGCRNHQDRLFQGVMLFLVLVLAIGALAFPPDEDPAGVDDVRASASWQMISISVPFICFSFLSILLLGLIGKIRPAEYVDSHIGEKRFAADMAISGCIDSPVTALQAAPSLFYSGRRPCKLMAARSFIAVPFFHFIAQRQTLICGGNPL